ncbi:UDP-glucoronosyl and UDP-glucosyl transferase [Ancylostoma caninum]|uniref:glucuronosyltransferase n=1 Tax=Ancylostoma caninum TaxID=29170 RepID=A0A368GWS5_ANCCA|nr:UDP-glucoronosyl and UDP-glucosyl transferase [Ancylostoma caninum]
MARKSLGPLGRGVHSFETVLSADQKTNDMMSVDKVFWFLEMAPEMFESPHRIGLEYLGFCLEDEVFRKIMRTPYDLVILDEMFSTAQGSMALKMRKEFGSKVATFTTTDLSSAFSMHRGISRNPVISPNYYTKGYDMQSFDVRDFWGRLKTIRDVIVEQYVINIAANNWLMKAGELLNTSSSYWELFEASYGTFMDFPSRYAYPASYSSSIIHVGEHCQEPNELPSDLREFVEDPSSKGTIYIAFGSIVSWGVSPPEVIAMFFDVLNSLTSYRIIFSYGGPEVKDLKSHVKIVAWAPQNDILSHNKTILFFTHGGLKSIKEGICSNTAMLFLPFFADQPRNALFARELGIAEVIYKKNITREELSFKINAVLTDPSYGLRTQKVSFSSILRRQYLDHVADPLDYGYRWAMRFIKLTDHHKVYYKNRGRLLSWVSFLYLDASVGLSLLCVMISG